MSGKIGVGVIVGRFQVHELHEGQRILFETVLKNHNKVLIFLGVSHCGSTQRNPLDFLSRKRMIQAEYPDVIILPLVDMKSDLQWSRQIDMKIKETFSISSEINIYGGRDSFIPYYKGVYQTVELPEYSYNSGSEIRQNIAEGEYYNSKDFRAGCIYTTYQQYQNPKLTIDVLIYNKDEVLLARKMYEDKYRLVGGFVDNDDVCLERTVKREVYEECNIEVDNIKYIKSNKIHDWRYESEKNKIMTVLFKAQYIFGKATPGDDIIELKWFNINHVCENIEELIEPEHREMFHYLKTYGY